MCLGIITWYELGFEMMFHACKIPANGFEVRPLRAMYVYLYVRH